MANRLIRPPKIDLIAARSGNDRRFRDDFIEGRAIKDVFVATAKCGGPSTQMPVYPLAKLRRLRFSLGNEALVNALKGFPAASMMNFWIVHFQVGEILFKPVSDFFEDDKLVRVVVLLKRVSDTELERHVETHGNAHAGQVVNGSPAAFNQGEQTVHSSLSMIRHLNDATRCQL